MHVPSMTKLGELNLSDRVEHGYTFLYDDLFTPIRYASVRILEIGYARGRGTRTLAEFFPRGIIHSFDIDPNWDHYNNLSKELMRRIKVYKGDQSDPTSIKEVLNSVYNGNRNEKKRGYKQFDIIIDDGSHQPEHQKISFDVLWPEVTPGGVYIIEDFHPYYHLNKHKTITWLFDLVHKLNKYGDKNGNVYLPDTYWIKFAYNQAIIRKKL